ncbi:MAG: bifunctional chorismate mutase/prephenate dehydrogenase [Gammaproteobacteria bacterium]|nr:bifunctional chorismate mutase/prephenate dehydrogenase [Gammaproteobacteria bacterium]
MADLENWRKRLSVIDTQLMELVAERHQLTERIGEYKRARGISTRDFAREKDVLEMAAGHARRLGLPESLAEDLMRSLIRSSLTQQERARVSAEGQGGGSRALVIGGAGKMGGWFVKYFASQGYSVEVADPSGEVAGFTCHADWQALALDYELILVATPLRACNDILRQLADRKPAGLIIEVASLKTPIREGLDALLSAGCDVASLHPMFGPDTELLSGRHLVFVDLGQPDSLALAKSLFASTMVELVQMGLDEHDKVIAFVLGLSHALNIMFFTALAESGEIVPKLRKISSTTFDAQLAVASRVAGESPTVYFEIQALNQYGGDALEKLGAAVERLRSVVAEADERGFAKMMQTGAEYLSAGQDLQGASAGD